MKNDLKELKKNLKLSWFFVKDQKKYLAVIISISLIMSIVSFIIPLLSAQLLIKLTNGFLKDLLLVVLIIFFIEITRNILSFFCSRLFEIYSIKATTNVQIKMFEETLRIETKVVEDKTSGTFIDRINNDTAEIIDIFSNLSSNIISLISNLGILFAIFIINKYMFMYFIINIFVINKIESVSRNIYQEKHKKLRLVSEKRTGLISEVVRGLKDVKLLNANRGIISNAKKQLSDVNKERINMTKMTSKFYLISSSVRDFFDILFYALGSLLAYFNSLSIANFVILYTYKDKVENLIFYYNRLARLIKDFNLSATRVFEVIGDELAKEQDDGFEIKNIKGDIEFKNVTFAYDSENVLKNVNLKINSGERIGFVGTSGSGKSTLFNLLTKLYPLEQGKILIDGKDINQISNISLRKNISLIPQNPYIFNFSVNENLKLGNLKASKTEIIDACKKAEIYDVINNLEKKV